MGARGPQPKHPSKKAGKSQPVSLTVLSSEVEVPPAPKGLLKITRDGWEAFWSSDLARAVSPTDLAALERLFRLRDEWERCYRAVRKEPLTVGSQGQIVEHPLSKRMDRMQTEIRQLEDRFGLSPQARARLNVSFVDATRSIDDLNRSYRDPDALRVIDITED